MTSFALGEGIYLSLLETALHIAPLRDILRNGYVTPSRDMPVFHHTLYVQEYDTEHAREYIAAAYRRRDGSRITWISGSASVQ
jgi:hypothetical protein